MQNRLQIGFLAFHHKALNVAQKARIWQLFLVSNSHFQSFTMKNQLNFLSLLFLSLLTFSLTSCSDDDDPIDDPSASHLLKEFKSSFGNSSYTERYAYLPNGKLKEFEVNSDNPLIGLDAKFEFRYKANGEVEKVIIDGETEVTVVYQNGKIVRQDEPDGEAWGTLTTTYEYNAAGQLAKRIEWANKGQEDEFRISEHIFAYHPDGNLKESAYYEYEDEENKALLQKTEYLSYDNKPLGRASEFQLPNTVMQKNNPISIRMTDDEGTVSTVTNTYEYNGAGLPAKLKSVYSLGNLEVNSTYTYY